MSKVDHYPDCTAGYPEKPKGEEAQELTRVNLGDGEYVLQCTDCGAHSGILTEE